MGVTLPMIYREGDLRRGQYPMSAQRRSGYAGVMNSLYRRILLVVLTVALVALSTAGCQTSKGFGKDVEKLGDKIQEKAN
jgi:predicted small secreted protein